jgi:hypothetical protein
MSALLSDVTVRHIDVWIEKYVARTHGWKMENKEMETMFSVISKYLIVQYSGTGNKTSLNAAERGGVEEGQRPCLFPRPSTVSSETDVFL